MPYTGTATFREHLGGGGREEGEGEEEGGREGGREREREGEREESTVVTDLIV